MIDLPRGERFTTKTPRDAKNKYREDAKARRDRFTSKTPRGEKSEKEQMPNPTHLTHAAKVPHVHTGHMHEHQQPGNSIGTLNIGVPRGIALNRCHFFVWGFSMRHMTKERVPSYAPHVRLRISSTWPMRRRCRSRLDGHMHEHQPLGNSTGMLNIGGSQGAMPPGGVPRG